MSAIRPFCIICEGKSEVSYLAKLAKFLEEEAGARNMFASPVGFVGKPAVYGAGGGDCRTVTAAFKREKNQNRKAFFRIWVDADLYVREKESNPTKFARLSPVFLGHSGSIPPFSFSGLLFEDFLAMHFDDTLFMDWKREFASVGHFNQPLSERNYLPLFQPYWHRKMGSNENYKKGDLPDDWITVESLANLFRHCDDFEVLSLVRKITQEPTFGEFLRKEILSVFPEWK